MEIKVTGRKVAVTDAMRSYVEDKIAPALKVFDIEPMTCDVVLRVDRNPSNLERKACEITVRARDSVVRVVSAGSELEACIDEAAEKVSRQLRKYKTRVLDRRQRGKGEPVSEPTTQDLDALIDEPDDELVREKYIDLVPMTEEEALVQTDLLGHDFYVFENATTGLINVIYRRNNGGYGIIKPKIEELDE